jgi:hypothetical protein
MFGTETAMRAFALSTLAAARWGAGKPPYPPVNLSAAGRDLFAQVGADKEEFPRILLQTGRAGLRCLSEF